MLVVTGRPGSIGCAEELEPQSMRRGRRRLRPCASGGMLRALITAVSFATGGGEACGCPSGISPWRASLLQLIAVIMEV